MSNTAKIPMFDPSMEHVLVFEHYMELALRNTIQDQLSRQTSFLGLSGTKAYVITQLLNSGWAVVKSQIAGRYHIQHAEYERIFPLEHFDLNFAKFIEARGRKGEQFQSTSDAFKNNK